MEIKPRRTQGTVHSEDGFMERVFQNVNPLRLLRICLICAIALLCMGVLSASLWGVTRSASSEITYDYKSISEKEYLEKNGTSVLSYEKNTNVLTVMLSEDLINTVLNEYLKKTEHRLGGYRIYDMVYRQKDNRFYISMQSGLFRVSVKAEAEITYLPETDSICFRILSMESSQHGNILLTWINEPTLPEFEIPAEAISMPDWLKVHEITLTQNQMLFDLQPDLARLSAELTETAKTEQPYLAWSNSTPGTLLLSRHLAEMENGTGLSAEDAASILTMVVDNAADLSSVLCLLTENTRNHLLDRYEPFLRSISETDLNEARESIRLQAAKIVGREMLVSLQSYLAGDIGTEPSPYDPEPVSDDNFYAVFAEADYLTDIAIVTQILPDQETSDQSRYVLDDGVIYDYNQSVFLTPEYVTGIFPVMMPYIRDLGDFRYYYQVQSGTISVLLPMEDGSVLEVTENAAALLTKEEARKRYPGYEEKEETAWIPDRSDPVLGELSQALDGTKQPYFRYVRICSDWAFAVYSPADHPERLRSAVLKHEKSGWSLESGDLLDYRQYVLEHPQVNATIFPLERTADMTLYTIGPDGLELLLEKAVRVNIAGPDEELTAYTFADAYIYTEFSDGTACVFMVGEDLEILSCRSVESALTNWELPAFFIPWRAAAE